MPATSELLRTARADMPPVTTEAATTLPVSAEVGYQAFSDVAATPQWLSIVHAAAVLARDRQGRPVRVSFRAGFERSSLGYVLYYRYRPHALAILWSTAPGGAICIRGEARFAPLSPRASLMTYRLSLELPVSPECLERQYGGHAASAVLGDFREHLRRAA